MILGGLRVFRVLGIWSSLGFKVGLGTNVGLGSLRSRCVDDPKPLHFI